MVSVWPNISDARGHSAPTIMAKLAKIQVCTKSGTENLILHSIFKPEVPVTVSAHVH